MIATLPVWVDHSVMADRPRLSIRLSEEAHSGWMDACAREGVSLTSLVEAIGRGLHEDPRPLLERGADLIQAARLIDQERRNRR